jgi:RecB family exonuclease
MAHTRIFSSSQALQNFLLEETLPSTLILVPHQRLARQLWHRQRLAALAGGVRAWEPLPCLTLGAWWSELAGKLWLPWAPAPRLLRLRLWRQAMATVAPPEGLIPDLAWAQALDDTHTLLARYRLRRIASQSFDAPLIAWRHEVSQRYEALLREKGRLSPAQVPEHLLEALEAGRLRLPKRILVVGLETPAPLEAEWLTAVGRRTEVTTLQCKGNPAAVKEAVVLRDPQEEMAWVAAELVESRRQGHPLHRLAVTSPVMDRYAPDFLRVLRELLGPPGRDDGWSYNFSAGPRLSDTSLFAAALLPLAFTAQGERREDLVSLLLSPFYARFKEQQGRLARWDRRFRENRLDRGWAAMRPAVSQEPEDEALAGLLETSLARLRPLTATAREWTQRLTGVWQDLGFPGQAGHEAEAERSRLSALLDEVAASLDDEVLTAQDFLDWLTHAGQAAPLPGPGVQEAGIQILGLLEMRGLDFDRVFCLGMNSRDFPAPPRPLPLLSPWERLQVLGGTAASQHRFAAELFANLKAAAPSIILTRPGLVDGEEQVGVYFWTGPWTAARLSPLSRPYPAWLRVQAVQAAHLPPAANPEAPQTCPIPVTVPDELRLTQLQAAFSCPCRFLLEVLLELAPLPDLASGIPPTERGQRLHQVAARFVELFGHILAQQHDWDESRARECLEQAGREVLGPWLHDPHWQAEWRRWFGDEAAPGLLTAWLAGEKERYAKGWRWALVEAAFQGLTGEGWPFALRGRLDRLDHHPESGELVVWDYKSGSLPSAAKIFQRLEEYQLPGYLLAVRQGVVEAPGPTDRLKAGFIGLKSVRGEHLKYEDFGKPPEAWEEVLAAWEDRLADLARRLARGDLFPAPSPAPQGRQAGACQYCPYPLVCGYEPLWSGEEEGAQA